MPSKTLDPTIAEFFETNRFFPDRMISPSKSAYMNAYTDRSPVFDAKLALGDLGLVWQGDLDLAIAADTDVLKKMASTFSKNVYVLSESAAMRLNSANDEAELDSAARQVFTP